MRKLFRAYQVGRKARYNAIRARKARDQDDRCFYCRCILSPLFPRTPTSITLDHIIPLSKSGQHRFDDPEHTVAACLRCNSHRGAMSFVRYTFHANARQMGVE